MSSSQPTPEDMLNLAHAIAAPFVRRHVRDSEEFADAYTALVQRNKDFDPERAVYSTFAYTVGRHAILQGRKSRRLKDVPTSEGLDVHELDSRDACYADESLRQVDIRDEYESVVASAGLTPRERQSVSGAADIARTLRSRATKKIATAATKRQNAMYA